MTLRSDLCHYSNVHIVVKGRISVRGSNNVNRIKKKLTFENKVPFRSCISKINNTFIENAEDLGFVIPIYDLFESSNNYFMTGSFWKYYRDEVINSANEIDGNDKINNKKRTRNSFEYKTKIIGRMPNYNNILDAEVVVPLKYLSNFWRSLDLPLINFEIELTLRWIKKTV